MTVSASLEQEKEGWFTGSGVLHGRAVYLGLLFWFFKKNVIKQIGSNVNGQFWLVGAWLFIISFLDFLEWVYRLEYGEYID